MVPDRVLDVGQQGGKWRLQPLATNMVHSGQLQCSMLEILTRQSLCSLLLYRCPTRLTLYPSQHVQTGCCSCQLVDFPQLEYVALFFFWHRIRANNCCQDFSYSPLLLLLLLVWRRGLHFPLRTLLIPQCSVATESNE